MIRTIYTCLVLLSFAGCHLAQDDSPLKAPSSSAFLQEDSLLVDSLLSTLTMEQQVAQLLMVPIYAKEDTNGWAEAERWTRDLGLGGVICMQGGPNLQRTRLRRLQDRATIPLMVASDAEWGLGMRLDSTRSFPRAMTLGATRNPALVRMFGQVGQSLEGHWGSCEFRTCGGRQLEPGQSRHRKPELRRIRPLGQHLGRSVCQWPSRCARHGHRQALPRSRGQRQRFSQDPPHHQPRPIQVGLHRVGTFQTCF